MSSGIGLCDAAMTPTASRGRVPPSMCHSPYAPNTIGNGRRIEPMYSRIKSRGLGFIPPNPPGTLGLTDTYGKAGPLALTTDFPELLLRYRWLPDVGVYRDDQGRFCLIQ